MANERTIYRVAHRTLPFSQIGNGMLRDKRLSFEARGALAMVLTYPADWSVRAAWLREQGGIGKDKAQSIIRELEAHRYCERRRLRTANGELDGVEYVFTDLPGVPQPENPSMAPQPENPAAGSTGAGGSANTNKVSHKDQIGTKKETGELHVITSGTDRAAGNRLPFTAAVLAEIGALSLDAAAIIDRYRQRTAGRRIADPSAYLLQMARDEAAKRLGVPVEALAGLNSGNHTERAMAQAAGVGAAPEPSEGVLRGVVRRTRARGDDPDELIAAWRASVRGRPVRDADRSLLLFADHRAMNRVR